MTQDVVNLDDRRDLYHRWLRSSSGYSRHVGRVSSPCRTCGQTFAWAGCGGECGWCAEHSGRTCEATHQRVIHDEWYLDGGSA
jgi:hypothetical protein